MIGIITSLFSLGTDIVRGIGEDMKSKRDHKRQVEEAIVKSKIKLAESAESHNQNWELEQIAGKDSLLRRFSFFLLSMPFVIAIVSPESVKQYFDVAISAVPEWYQYAYMAVLGAVWGISEFKKWKS